MEDTPKSSENSRKRKVVPCMSARRANVEKKSPARYPEKEKSSTGQLFILTPDALKKYGIQIAPPVEKVSACGVEDNTGSVPETNSAKVKRTLLNKLLTKPNSVAKETTTSKVKSSPVFQVRPPSTNKDKNINQFSPKWKNSKTSRIERSPFPTHKNDQIKINSHQTSDARSPPITNQAVVIYKICTKPDENNEYSKYDMSEPDSPNVGNSSAQNCINNTHAEINANIKSVTEKENIHDGQKSSSSENDVNKIAEYLKTFLRRSLREVENKNAVQNSNVEHSKEVKDVRPNLCVSNSINKTEIHNEVVNLENSSTIDVPFIDENTEINLSSSTFDTPAVELVNLSHYIESDSNLIPEVSPNVSTILDSTANCFDSADKSDADSINMDTMSSDGMTVLQNFNVLEDGSCVSEENVNASLEYETSIDVNFKTIIDDDFEELDNEFDVGFEMEEDKKIINEFGSTEQYDEKDNTIESLITVDNSIADESQMSSNYVELDSTVADEETDFCAGNGENFKTEQSVNDSSIDQSFLNTITDLSNIQNDSEDETVASFIGHHVSTPKKRGRKPKESKNGRTSSALENIDISSIKKGRGRKRQSGSENSSTSTDLNNKKAVKGKTCKCMICFEVMPQKDWLSHKRKNHNLLAWCNNESPIDLEDESKVMNILKQKVLLDKKIKCEKCPEVRKSVMGFIAHLKVCQKSEEEINNLRVPCPECKRLMLPQSLYLHLPLHKKMSIFKDSVVNVEKDVSLKPKRRAAQEAENSFKKLKTEVSDDDNDNTQVFRDFCKKVYGMIPNDVKSSWDHQERIGGTLSCMYKGCNHVEPSAKKIRQHCFRSCPMKPKLKYMCKICTTELTTFPKFKEHLLTTHAADMANCVKSVEDHDFSADNVSSSDEYSEQVDSEIIASRRSIVKGLRFLFSYQNMSQYGVYHFNLAKEFVSNNYSTECLFSDLSCDKYTPLSSKVAKNYLPVIEESCNTSYSLYGKKKIKVSQDNTWKKYKLFESDINNGSITMWCGGPVYSLAWVPGNDTEKYLAVATGRKMDDRRFSNKLYSHENVIQIWNVGSLKNDMKCIQTPGKIEYSIAHNHGIVWDMSFCPSGCNDISESDVKNKNLTRMGLLGIACSNGKAYIYAICHPLNFHQSSSTSKSVSTVYQTKPLIELLLNDDNDVSNDKPQAVKIAWSNMKCHKILAVGYSNGFVALYDIFTKSTLLRSEAGGIIKLRPYSAFQPYTSFITGLTIIPLNNHNEENDLFLGIASLSNTGIWYGSIPIIDKFRRHSHITNSFPWPQILIFLELLKSEHSKNSGSSIYLLTPKFNGSGVVNMSHSEIPGGGVLGSSVWSDGYIVGANTGDVIFKPITTPLHSKLINSKKRSIIMSEHMSFAEMVPLDKRAARKQRLAFEKRNVELQCEITKSLNYEFEPETETYQETDQRYGLHFIDVPLDSEERNDLKILNSIKECPIDRWQLRSILSIQTNPDMDAFMFQAVGGRSGHVRIMRSPSIKYNAL